MQSVFDWFSEILELEVCDNQLSTYKMRYTQINRRLGKKMASHIWNVFLTENPDMFVTPYGNRQLRRKCHFAVGNKIYLHLSNQEIVENFPEGITDSDKIFLYGAFNQAHVNQIKIVGNLRILKNACYAEQAIRNKLLTMNKENDESKPRSRQDEIDNALNSMKDGVFLSFTPTSYEHAEYENEF